MLAWVLNAPLLFDSSIFLIFKVFYIIRLLKFAIFLKHFPSFNSLNMLLLKPFDLVNTIPLTRTKALVNNLLISKF